MKLVLLIILSIVVIWHRLGYKRKMIYLFCKHNRYLFYCKNHERLNNDGTRYVPNILCYILLPFIIMSYVVSEVICPDYILKYFYGGGVHVLPIALELDDERYSSCKLMLSKYFWYVYFNKQGIKHPIVYAHNDSLGVVRIERDVPSQEQVIVKPFYGAGGQDIQLKSFKEYYESQKECSMLVQEYVKDYSHFRVLTSYDLKTGCSHVFYIGEYRNPGSITTNREAGGKIFHCYDELCSNTLSRMNQEHLRNISHRLCTAHETDFTNMVFVGWDVLINDDQSEPYVLEGNPMPGVVGLMKPNTWNTYEDYLKVIKSSYDCI